MSLSKIVPPPETHPFFRKYSINTLDELNIENTPTEIPQTFKSQTFTTINSQTPLLAIDNKPPIPPKPSNSSIVNTNNVNNTKKPEKTPEQIQKDKEEANRKQKEYEEELKKAIIIDVVDDYKNDDISDKDILEKEFNVVVVPSETGDKMYTYIENYQEFASLINNDFEIVMIYIASFLKTSYKCIEEEDKKIWYFEDEFSHDDIDNQRLRYISDVVTCNDCHCFNSVIVKDNENNLIRICNSSKCNSTCPIGYTESDIDEENMLINLMIQEITNRVSLYSPITIEYTRLPRKKGKELTEQEKAFHRKLEEALNTKSPTSYSHNVYKPHNNAYNSVYNYSYGASHTYGKPKSNITTYDFRNTVNTNNVYVPATQNAGNRGGGYIPQAYGGYFKDKCNNTKVSSGHVQTISEAKQKFGLQNANDGREYFTYTNSKKENFQLYIRFLTAKIQEHHDLISKDPFNNKETDATYWGLSTNVLLSKAKELNIMDVAVMANVMYLFDNDILETNQLVTKRKYLMAFINNNPEVTGLYFLMGIENIIHDNELALFSKADEIMQIGLEQKYFTLDAYDIWVKTENIYPLPDNFSKKLRNSLQNWRKILCDDSSSDEEEFASDEEGETMKVELFSDTDEVGDLLADDGPNYDDKILLNQSHTEYNSETFPFKFNSKTFSLENNTGNELLA